MYKPIRISFFCSILGVLILAIPLLIHNQRDVSEALWLLAGIELPIVLIAIQEAFYAHLGRRIVPIHFGNVSRTIIMFSRKEGKNHE